MVDLSQPGQCQALSDKIAKAVDAYSLSYDNGPRDHLGTSQIGHACNWYLWAGFRWLAHNPGSGRMQRLFRRGHLEEMRYIEYLEGIGFEVWTADANGRQFRIAAVSGHFGGSCDGVGKAPPEWQIDRPLLLEFKTKGTGAGFNDLRARGVKLSAPQHYGQMSVYGKGLGLTHGLYMAVNKNDDDIHIEVVELDYALADELIARAQHIIESPAHAPPSKVSLQPTYYLCKNCQFLGPCHHAAEPIKNCRSCQFSTPVDNGQWYCGQYDSIIPGDVIPKGCDRWQSLLSAP